MKIKKNGVYGHFKAKKKLDSGEFGCICIYCGKKKKFDKQVLSVEPKCKCQKNLPATTKSKTKKKDLVIDDQKLIDDYLKKTEKTLDNISSVFGDSANDIKDLILRADKSQGFEKFQAEMLRSLIDTIVIAENQYNERPGQSNAYALNALISQAREIIADLQAAEESSNIVGRLVSEVMLPEFTNIGQSIINQMFYLKKNVKPSIKEGREQQVDNMVDDATKELARNIEDVFKSVQKHLRKYLE